MTTIHPGRWSGAIEGDLVVFLIGMRINRPTKVRSWLPVARAMGPMQAELRHQPELGCLHIENWFGRTTISLQYWTDTDSLNRYARGELHLPAWREFNRRVRDCGDVGIWHETFRVGAGEYETVYANMPRFGLAAAGRHQPTRQLGQTAAARLGEGADEAPPVDPY